jgi:hypothetical protein
MTIMNVLPKMKIIYYLGCFCIGFIFLFPWASISAQDKLNLSGQATLGYIFIDDNGNKGTTEEIFNTYSGFALQNLNLQGLFAKNSTFELDLANINRDNRTFLFTLKKPGLFSLNSQCNKSRFIFDEKGDVRSFRTMSSVAADFQVAKFLKLRGNYFHHLQEGDRRASLDGAGAWGEKYDQFFQSGGLGMQLKWGRRYFDLEYRLRSFDDDIKSLFRREGDQLKAILNTPLPSHIFLSVSYLHDKNRLKESGLNLTTNLFQGSIFYQPLRKLNLSTKSLFQRIGNQATGVTSDIFRVGEEIRYEFHSGYDVNLGYEYERRKEVQKVEVNSFLAGFYFQFIPQLSLKARYLFQKRKDPDTLTLTGPFDNERILVELKSRPLKEVNLKLRYEDKTRKNPDIFTSTKDRGYISYASFALKDWLDIQLNYYFLTVKYDNSLKDFTVDNNTFTSMAILKPSDNFTLSGGWNHIDLRKDLDIRKDGFSLGVEYSFWKDFSFQAKYDLYTYDDYIRYLDYYGANVYTVSLTKKFGGI